MNVIAVRPSEISGLWVGETQPGSFAVVVVLKCGAKLQLAHKTAEHAALDYDRLVDAMRNDELSVVRAGAI